MPRALLIGRVTAAVQGIVWLLLLSHGGWGFITAPMAFAAAAFARSRPLVSSGLLLIPVVALTASWAPILLASTSSIMIWLVLVAPAITSVVLILVPWKRPQ